MTIVEAKANIAWLQSSFLVADGSSLESAAETYDEMNDNTVFQDSLNMYLGFLAVKTVDDSQVLFNLEDI